jgi:hypothetical protein
MHKHLARVAREFQRRLEPDGSAKQAGSSAARRTSDDRTLRR